MLQRVKKHSANLKGKTTNFPLPRAEIGIFKIFEKISPCASRNLCESFFDEYSRAVSLRFSDPTTLLIYTQPGIKSHETFKFNC